MSSHNSKLLVSVLIAYLSPLAHADSSLLALTPTELFSHSHRVEASNEQLYEVYRKAFTGSPITGFCHCPIVDRSTADAKSCSITSPGRTWMKLSGIKWTTIVSPKEIAERLNLKCWTKEPCINLKGEMFGGEKCCFQKNEIFRGIESDMNNIMPLAAPIAHYRNLRVEGKVTGLDADHFGLCGFSSKGARFHAPEYTKGKIARSWLYLHQFYGIPISKTQQESYIRASKSYPPTYHEKSLAKAIREFQGYANPFVINDWHEKKSNHENRYIDGMLKDIGSLKDVLP